MTLIEAVKSVKEILRSRRAAHKVDGVLAQTYVAAMHIWDAQKEQGVTIAERQAGLEKSLRAAWPQTREWHYLCVQCDDTGFEFRVCREGARCGRQFKLPGSHADDHTGRGNCGDTHNYMVPCRCSKGRDISAGLHKQPLPSVASDFTQAGRTKPTNKAMR